MQAQVHNFVLGLFNLIDRLIRYIKENKNDLTL